jgi:hypothetical protein
LPNSLVNNSMATTMRFGMGRTTIKRGPGKRLVDGKSFRLAFQNFKYVWLVFGGLHRGCSRSAM